MLHLAVIILNWQQPELTIKTVSSFFRVTHRLFDYHIYLVDNGSADDSFSIFSAKYKNNPLITLVQTGSNLGFVGGNNFAIKQALTQKYDYLLLANNDIVVDSGFLDRLVAAAVLHPRFGALGPKIYFAPGYEFHRQRYSKSQIGRVIWSAGGKMDWQNILGSNIGVDEVDQGQYDKINTKVDFLTGCCLLLRTKAIRQIGLLNTDYFMYLEDTDYSQRLKLQGWKIAYIPDAKIWHLNSGSSKTGSSLHDYYLTRNRLIFGARYASWRTRFALFRESFRFLFQNPVRRRAVIDFYTHRLGKGSF